MPFKVTQRLFLTRAAIDALPPILRGVTLDNPAGIPCVALSGHEVEAHESGWIRVDAVPDDAEPSSSFQDVVLRFPATSVVALVSVGDDD